jgi:hypothetical protein
MLDGEEGIFCDRRVARALCGKGLMGVAGYVIGETVYAFTDDGLALRDELLAASGMDARSGETGTGSTEGDSPTAEGGDAQTPPPSERGSGD